MIAQPSMSFNIWLLYFYPYLPCCACLHINSSMPSIVNFSGTIIWFHPFFSASKAVVVPMQTNTSFIVLDICKNLLNDDNNTLLIHLIILLTTHISNNIHISKPTTYLN